MQVIMVLHLHIVVMCNLVAELNELLIVEVVEAPSAICVRDHLQ